MKIIRDGFCYIQVSDLKFLINYDMNLPEKIRIALIDSMSDQEFVRFDDGGVVEFLRRENFLVDFDEVNKKSEPEIVKLGQQIVLERNMLVARFNNMSQRDKRSNIDLMLKAKMLDYKIKDLTRALWIKKGKLKVDLPDGTFVEAKKESGISRLKRIFSK